MSVALFLADLLIYSDHSIFHVCRVHFNIDYPSCAGIPGIKSLPDRYAKGYYRDLSVIMQEVYSSANFSPVPEFRLILEVIEVHFAVGFVGLAAVGTGRFLALNAPRLCLNCL